MVFPLLLKRVSSISVRVQEERGAADATEESQKTNIEAEHQPCSVLPELAEIDDDADTDIVDDMDGDTEAAVTSEDDANHDDSRLDIGDQESKGKVHDEAAPIRMSKRLMSLKRRGKFIPLTEKLEQIEFYAEDTLTVRGENCDYFVCRVLEDVLENANNFSVAWYNRVGDNLYEASYDDICYKASVITRVKLLEKSNDQYSILQSHVKQTRKLLREVLQTEKKDIRDLMEEDDEGEIADEEEEEDDEGEIADEEEEEDDDGQPPPKKRKTRSARKTVMQRAARGEAKDKKERKPKEKKEKKAKIPKGRKGLVPNPVIELVDKDPIFDTKADIPLMPVKRGIRAVLLNDMDMLKKAIEDTENVYTVHWERSADIKRGPVHYALMNGNLEALDLLDPAKWPKKRKAKKPNITLSKMDTGKYNFYTFGHAVRPLQASRGSKEGNNAFLKENGSVSDTVDDSYLMKNGISPKTIQHYLKVHKLWEIGQLNNIWQAVRHGHRELASFYVTKAMENDGFGFNFLHKEVLVNQKEPLSKFKASSVTKKPYDNQTILPIHCACINPNTKYLKALFNVVPDYTIADKGGWKPIHYAAACEGAGPLRYLLTRGVDPNDTDNKGITPLMIAAKLGRDENIKELMSVTISADELMDEDEIPEEVVNEEEPKEQKRVNIDARKKNSKAAIHIAAIQGNESTIRTLVEQGATVDLQTAAGKNNFTALTYAAQKGHLNVVKTLVELGAGPDKKVKQNKTALMVAAQNGHYKIMAYLLHIGVNPNAQDTSQNTPIHYASAYGWYHCVQLLLEGGADPNVANNWKTTPLAIALMKDNVSCADLLLSVDVDVDFPDDEGRTILVQQILIEYDDGMFDKIKYLVEKKGANANKADMKENSPLHYLAAHSVYEYIETMASDPLFGVSVFLGKDNNRRPQFKKESSEICCKIAEILIKAGANLNGVNNEGQTPLMIAVLQNNFPLIKVLLQHGASASVGTDITSKRTVLGYLIQLSDKLELLEYFDDDRDVSKITDAKLKRIHKEQYAKAKEEILELFVDGGVDLNAQDSCGETPLMMCYDQGNADYAEIILNKGANPTLGKNRIGHNILHVMARKCTNLNLTTFLSRMRKKFDFKNMVNEVDNDGFTPLLIACEAYANDCNGKEGQALGRDFIKELLQHYKADATVVVEGQQHFDEDDVNRHRTVPMFGLSIEKDKKNNDDDNQCIKNLSCLHYFAIISEKPASLEKNVATVTSPGLRMFLSFLGNTSLLNFRDRHGRTPLHLAVLKENTDAVVVLAENGADVNLLSENREKDGLQPPLCMASRPPCQLDVAKALLHAKADPNLADGIYNRCALSYAVENRTADDVDPLELAKSILKAGASVNAADIDKRTALHHSVNKTSGGYETLVQIEELLVNHGADTTVLDNLGRLPLHYAFVKMESKESENMTDPISIVHMLCDAAKDQGKDVSTMLNTAEDNGRTPLHLGAIRGATISCLHMLKHGASLSVQDNDKNYPISLALRSKHHGCAMMFIQEGSTANCDVIRAVTKAQIDEFKRKKESNTWKWKPILSLKEPQADVRSAFYVAVENDWQGVAYVMLELAHLPFIDAFKAASKARKLRLLFTLLKKQRHNETLLVTDDNGSNLLHLLATHVTSSNSAGVDVQDKSSLKSNEDNGDDDIDDRDENDDGDEDEDEDNQGSEDDKEEQEDEEEQQDDDESEPEDHVQEIEDDDEEEEEEQQEEEEEEEDDSKKEIKSPLPVTYSDEDLMFIKIGQLLIERGVAAGALDTFGTTPLHYAAYNAHEPLCKLFIEKSLESVNVANKDGMTPIAAVFNAAYDNGSVEPKHVKIVSLLKGTKLDICYKTNTKTNGNAEEFETTTILNDQVLLKNSGNFSFAYSSDKTSGAVEYLLDNGADVNFSNDNGETAMMLAVKMNSEDMVNILLKYKPDMKATDKQGKSLIHVCVSNKDYGSSENTSMLKLLEQNGAPVNMKDKDGHTPLFYAQQQMSGVMAATLREFKATYEDEEIPMETGEPGFYFQTISVDKETNISGDSEKELLKLKNKKDATGSLSVDQPPPVDQALNMGETGEVYIDPKTGIPYDVVLTKVDVKHGTYGLNNFYKLQVIHHKGKDLWILFNRWGRIGDKGQHQQTPFLDPVEACDQFKKIWKSKTGNDWSDFPSRFEKKPKKYTPVLNNKNPERMLHRQDEILESWDLRKCPDSKLSEGMQTFMKDITDLDKFKNSISTNSLLDIDYMPFGLVTSEVVQQAKEVLQKIMEIVKVDDPDLPWKALSDSLYEEVAELSNEFYMMIPPPIYQFEKIPPLNDVSSVEWCMYRLRSLTELSCASQLLLAAQHRKKEINPLDYCYRGLGSRIEMMDPNSAECQLILEYIEHAKGSYTVKGIYRVHRYGEENNFEECGVKHNRELLWHGTRRAHMVSILKHGLQIDPPYAHISASFYGKGIYFSYSLKKAISHSTHGSDSDSKEVGHVLLCEVALGDSCIFNNYNESREFMLYDDSQSVGKNSVWVVGNIADPKEDVITPYGAKMRVGNYIVKEPTHHDHECVVFDPRQVRMRYIVMISSDLQSSNQNSGPDVPAGWSYSPYGGFIKGQHQFSEPVAPVGDLPYSPYMG